MTASPVPRSKKDRDAGLRRVGTVTRWTLAGALAGTGLFAGLAAQHGHSTTARTASGSSSATTSNSTQTSSSSSGTSSSDSSSSGTTSLSPTTVQSGSSSGSVSIVSGAS